MFKYTKSLGRKTYKPTIKVMNLLYFLLAFLLTGSSAEDPEQGSSAENSEPDYKAKINVDISGLSVKITCDSEFEDLVKGDQEISKGTHHELTDFTAEKNGLYKCGKRPLFLNAYVCETCTEVTVYTVAMILIADFLVTFGVTLLIYFGSKKKSSRNNRMANGGQTRDIKERPPPVPDPDYMPLQKGRRDVYDGLNRKL